MNMSKIDDGGPASPQINETSGMTLREYFAGQALAGLLADPTVRGEGLQKKVARLSFEIADAMLAARPAPEPNTLRAENERLREALKAMLENYGPDRTLEWLEYPAAHPITLARAALKEGGDT